MRIIHPYRSALATLALICGIVPTVLSASLLPGSETPEIRAVAQLDPPEEERRVMVTVIRSRSSETIKVLVNLAEESEGVRISLYNLLGRQLLSLPSSSAPAGETTHQIDTRELPDGHYFVVVEANDQRLTKKVFIFR